MQVRSFCLLTFALPSLAALALPPAVHAASAAGVFCSIYFFQSSVCAKKQIGESARSPTVCLGPGGHHGELRTREIDNGVAEALQARGYVVLRFTGREILQDGALCLARIRRALERASEQSAA